MDTLPVLRAVVHGIVSRPHGFDWSTQGFGMLRTYFGHEKRFRLNIWHHRLEVPLCSIIHDHPWAFESMVLCGEFENRRYSVEPATEIFATHRWQVIRTGPGGGPDGEAGWSKLQEQTPETYTAGDVYSQRPDEVHGSFYHDGTMTINDRTYMPDGEHARVFWPVGQSWVDAMPREATAKEINVACEKARMRIEGAWR